MGGKCLANLTACQASGFAQSKGFIAFIGIFCFIIGLLISMVYTKYRQHKENYYQETDEGFNLVRQNSSIPEQRIDVIAEIEPKTEQTDNFVMIEQIDPKFEQIDPKFEQIDGSATNTEKVNCTGPNDQIVKEK